MSTSLPPRFVPTLTEVVHDLSSSAAPAGAETLMTPPIELQEQMVQRVLQRVDLLLERRLREAVGQLILEHTETLAPRLREEIGQVVRQTVNQAFEQELAQTLSRS